MFSQAEKLQQMKSKVSAAVRAVCCLLPMLVPAFSQSALAGALSGSGAPLAAARQMAADGPDTANPFSYPLLRDIAKSLARNGFPASFFLSLDSKAGPGIDLRTILLYEAGVLKSPVKLLMSSHKKKSEFPTLSVGSIPETTGEMPSSAPKLSMPGALESATPEKAASASTNSSEKNKDNPALSLDLSRFSIDLSDSRLKNELTSQPSPEIGTLAMLPPLTLATKNPGPEESAFRFWTVPQAIALPEKITGKSPYAGSFVMMSPSGLKAVEGRMFFLTNGQILLSSGGKPLVVDTPLARVSVEAGATAYVEIGKSGSSRVRVLETKPGEHGVSVKYNADGKACEIRLEAADDFLVADHSLSEAEKSVQDRSRSQAASGDNWSKSCFSPKAVFDSESFFSTDSPWQNPEQRSAMVSLRKRLK